MRWRRTRGVVIVATVLATGCGGQVGATSPEDSGAADARVPGALRPDGCPVSMLDLGDTCSERGKICLYKAACESGARAAMQFTCEPGSDGLRWSTSYPECRTFFDDGGCPLGEPGPGACSLPGLVCLYDRAVCKNVDDQLREYTCTASASGATWSARFVPCKEVADPP